MNACSYCRYINIKYVGAKLPSLTSPLSPLGPSIPVGRSDKAAYEPYVGHLQYFTSKVHICQFTWSLNSLDFWPLNILPKTPKRLKVPQTPRHSKYPPKPTEDFKSGPPTVFESLVPEIKYFGIIYLSHFINQIYRKTSIP